MVGANVPIVSIRPPDPSYFLGTQLEFVANYAALRADRMHENFAQMSLPIGFLGAIAYLSDRTPRTNEPCSQRVASLFSSRCVSSMSSPSRARSSAHRKFSRSSRRRCMARFRAVIQPRCSSWRGCCHACSRRRAAISTRAGKSKHAPRQPGCGELYRRGHDFPVDSMAGCILGLSLGDYFFARCQPTGGSYRDWTFNGTELHHPDRRDPQRHDFNWRLIETRISASQPEPELGLKPGELPHEVAGIPELGWLWQEALKEWKADTAAPADGG